jgi:hypothetical protein
VEEGGGRAKMNEKYANGSWQNILAFSFAPFHNEIHRHTITLRNRHFSS